MPSILSGAQPMIAFACSHCSMKLKVRDEFGGRHSKCPSCKQPLVVPLPSVTVPPGPPQVIRAESSLVKAGIDAGVTLDPHDTAQPLDGKRAIDTVMAARGTSNSRYVIEGEIARGGMGAVLRAVDCDLRREVAVKYMLDQTDQRKKARFVEEAQINGQLEHPNIVPVYDLGIDAQKRPFIMMKMVKGQSLKDVLDQLRANARQTERQYSLGRLLNILVNVCHALAYAHSRGVVHRDLKPANIMLGHFGEVYVMDWGLAKVLSQPDGETTGGLSASQLLATTSTSSKVVTSREPATDLTQEGSVLGTPAYMPPEQATGRLQAIDQRSDVYSLGAILYEMLTLQIPVDKEGGHLAMLMRVVEGEIIPPEQRAPDRVRQGKVPPELSAIARKALARDPDARYPTVEAFRQDIERFQEGRSVSAKEDTRWEVLWKFVKRNPGLCAGVTVALVVLCCSTIFLFKAYWETRQAKAASELARLEKDRRTQQAVPALIVAARETANLGNFDAAIEQTAVILDYDPGNADAHLLRAQILLAHKRPARAREELRLYLASKPQDADAQKLFRLCDADQFEDPPTLLAVAEALQRQRAFGAAAPLLADIQRLAKERGPLVPHYQKQVDAAWPGLGHKLWMDSAGQYHLDFTFCKQVTSLERLKGMPIGFLSIRDCDVPDLSPLKGMNLIGLNIAGCQRIRDLSPLEGMRLRELDMGHCLGVSDLKPLGGMPLASLAAHGCPIRDLSPLKGAPLSELRLDGCREIRDIAPLKGMPLTLLELDYCELISDLAPLQGMPLKTLKVGNCKNVTDLTPLKGMPLTTLAIWETRVNDLTPLQGMPLTYIDMPKNQVYDLSPLEGMKLETVFFTPKNIRKGINVLRKMASVKTIGIAGHAKDRLTPDEFWRKYDAGEFRE
jgi:serine/threonine protein kinase